MGDPGHEDPIEWLSSRPDFAVLLYPVITFQEPYLHAGSMHNLLGDDPSEEMRKALSNELQVTANTPPTFLAHTDEDTAVPAENSLLFYQALRNAGVPAELHLFREGRHGLGMRGDLPFAQWPFLCEQCLKGTGFLSATETRSQDGGSYSLVMGAISGQAIIHTIHASNQDRGNDDSKVPVPSSGNKE